MKQDYNGNIESTQVTEYEIKDDRKIIKEDSRRVCINDDYC